MFEIYQLEPLTQVIRTFTPMDNFLLSVMIKKMVDIWLIGSLIILIIIYFSQYVNMNKIYTSLLLFLSILVQVVITVVMLRNEYRRDYTFERFLNHIHNHFRDL